MVIKAHRLTSIREKTKGLIGAEKALPVYFETRWGIHTFGMKYPIDVLILDNKNRVVKIAERLNPNKILLWNLVYKKVLELPEREIHRLDIKTGSLITIRPV